MMMMMMMKSVRHTSDIGLGTNPIQFFFSVSSELDEAKESRGDGHKTIARSKSRARKKSKH